MSEIHIQEMTEEDLNELNNQHDMLAKICGFENGDEMEKFKVDASMGMIRFGGGFAQPLGHALAHADMINTAKIIRAFPEMCHEHAVLHRKFIQKRDE